ncbi:C-X-C motif chemokine 16-like [Nycticebus coucang]|uniref:C-X-C motif chemokine 16-like n=1 Tax=Nycticebus coucang TaxID=9470 RepID=UPI00234E31DF|nr:C-X-C motif chemokine 16-like [Nycticebus coucang]
MWPGWLPCSLLLLLLAQLTQPGDGNENSIAGSCHCDKIISSDSPPSVQFMGHLRIHLKGYRQCPNYVRFQLRVRSVCGGSKAQWVQELMRCFDLQECGHGHTGPLSHQKHLPPPSTQLPEPSNMGTPAQILVPSTLQSTQHPTLSPGSLSLDKELPHPNVISPPPTVGHRLGAGHKTGENQKQLEESAGPKADISTIVPILPLLVVIFLLTGILVYVVCKRRREKSLQSSPDLHLHYSPVTPDSNT